MSVEIRCEEVLVGEYRTLSTNNVWSVYEDGHMICTLYGPMAGMCAVTIAKGLHNCTLSPLAEIHNWINPPIYE